MAYLFATEDEQQQMLEAIGVKSIDDLFENIPEEVRCQQELDLPAPLAELELDRKLQALSADYIKHSQRCCFLGGGAYDHFIPATVDEICSRGEFYTAYTPYQPEASQGTLQAFFEFQSLISELTGLDVANASLYEGASALAEAAIMAIRCTNRAGKVIVSATVHPEYIETLKTYLRRSPCEVVICGDEEGVTNWNQLDSLIDETTAAVVVQQPNFFGCFEDVQSMVEQTHEAGALAIEVFDPVSLGVLKRPGDYGIDIAVAEGQSLGTPLQFGGPYLGIMACRDKFVRKMPGRLIGETTDKNGKRSFVLNLQTREQHIRRDKATSNICTNQGLMALRASVYLAQLGSGGLRELGEQCVQKANYAAEALTAAGLGSRHYSQPIFKEFLFRFNKPADEITTQAREAGYDLGPEMSRFDLSAKLDPHSLLIAVTEKRTYEEIDALVAALSS